MNLLYPRFTLRQFGGMMLFGLAGSVVAGLYGIAHDQVTFSLGPEYFTHFKFDQFHYLDQTRAARVLVAQIGFLATWWVGFFAGWFMGRVTIPHLQLGMAARQSGKAVLMMLVVAFLFAVAAWLGSPVSLEDPRVSRWKEMLDLFRVQDTLSFIRVGYIHNASYLGGLIGLIGALIWLRWSRPSGRS